MSDHNNNHNHILDLAKNVIILEANAINHLQNLLTDNFVNAANYIHQARGRVIITGIGKSANIAQKIVATFNSTGTPAIFMHAADAIHGDLGIIQKQDTLICLSKSGNTPEIKVLLPLIKNFGNKIIGITGNTESYLAQQADFLINCFVEKEACPNNLAPTTSTTAQLVLGDALAVTLLNLNKFSSQDFAKYHPGGALGKQLYLRVKDLMIKNKSPKVFKTSDLKEVIISITESMLGTTAVVENNKVIGIITDGDLRRMLHKDLDFKKLTANDIMGKNPKTIPSNSMAVEALNIMESNNITQLLVIDDDQYVGVIHLHDLIKEGIY